jgi:hypothetical protein
MLKNGLMLISFAWAMEIVGVTGGVINSVYTTFGDELPGTLGGYIPALPMVALAAAELGRVPLASAIFHKHWLMMMVALVGIISLGYIAVENWTFGFEHVVDLRLKPVKMAIREVQLAEAEVSRLREQGERLAAGAGRKREEMRAGVAQHDAGISDVTAQLAKEAETHQKNLEGIREACRIIRDACMVPRSQAEDARYAAVVNRLGTDLEHQREERKALQKQIDGWVAADAADAADIDRKNALAAYAATEARKAFRAAADGNQIFRLAANWYGVATADVTPEQFATVRWAFSTFSAVAIAFVGSVAALVHYSNNRVPGSSLIARSAAKVARARRAYYARLRKPLRVEVEGPERVVYRDGKEPIVVEKEIVRFIDKIVLIPRWGIWMPFLVNSLWGKNGGHASQEHNAKDEPDLSNVKAFKKAH